MFGPDSTYESQLEYDAITAGTVGGESGAINISGRVDGKSAFRGCASWALRHKAVEDCTCPAAAFVWSQLKGGAGFVLAARLIGAVEIAGRVE
jgi:hypothetical protein